jgi:K+-sensing histidine kinase KdpD
VAFTSHRRAAEASLLRKQATILQNYSQEIVAASNADAIASTTSEALAALFRVPAVVMLTAQGNAIAIKRTGEVEPESAELDAARSSLATGTVVRGGVYPHLASRFDFWPVRTPDGQTAVIGLAFDPDERPAEPDTQVTIVARILALMLDRERARETRL